MSVHELSPKGKFLRTTPWVGPIGFSGSLYLLLFPKGEFLRTNFVGTIVWKRFSCVIGKKNGASYDPFEKPPFIGWLGEWVVGGRIYLFKTLLGKTSWFLFLFFLCITIRGNDIIFFQYQQGNIRARSSKMGPKIDTFCHFNTRVLSILGVKKVVFCTFPKVF